MRPQSLKKRTSAPSPVFPTPNCVCWTSSADLHAGHRGTEGFGSWLWNERGFYEGRGKPSLSFELYTSFLCGLSFGPGTVLAEAVWWFLQPGLCVPVSAHGALGRPALQKCPPVLPSTKWHARKPPRTCVPPDPCFIFPKGAVFKTDSARSLVMEDHD